MAVAFRVRSVAWLGLGLSFAGVGCSSEPAPASADDVAFPNWAEQQAARGPIEARRLQESENSSHAGIEADPNDAEHKERRERQLKASESTLLPDSADSKFFGGCGAMRGKCTKEPPH
jgi:hypothetical protein